MILTVPRGIAVSILGAVDYDTALTLQREAHERVLAGTSPGTVFLLEHDPPVITQGRRAGAAGLLVPEEALAPRGYQLRHAGRGGDITVHEPGQVVVYFVLPVQSKSAAPFVKGILGLMAAFLEDEYGIAARYDAARPGLWAGNEKLCAAGVDLSGGVSMHGIAVNVSNSMEGFSLIVPCGMEGAGVTSVSALLGRRVDAGAFMEKFAARLRALAG